MELGDVRHLLQRPAVEWVFQGFLRLVLCFGQGCAQDLNARSPRCNVGEGGLRMWELKSKTPALGLPTMMARVLMPFGVTWLCERRYAMLTN